MTPPLIICDFDGTLAEQDVGNTVMEHFGPPEWIQINERFHRGELSLPEAQRRMWALARGDVDSMRAHAVNHCHLRKGADMLLQAAEDGRVELILASGGFGFYIRALLGPRLSAARHIYHNELQDTQRGGVVPHFPHDELHCPSCAVCKARVIERHREQRTVFFCGDGGSDRCAARVADHVFSVQGKRLSAYCTAEGIKHTDFEDFRVVLDACLGG